MVDKVQSFINSWKGLLSVVVALLSVITYFAAGVDSKIDTKILQHEQSFELEQREVVSDIKTDIATIKENNRSQQRQLDSIQEQGKHTQELVEQLIRENR